MFALVFFNVYSFTQLNIWEQFKHFERRCLRDVKKLFKFIQTRDWGSYRCDWRFEKKNLRTFWPRVSLRCYRCIVYDNTFLHFKKPGLYSRVCSCQWNIQWLSICWLIISDLFFLFKLLVLQNQLFRWERLPTLTVNWNKFCIFTHLILRNPCCNVAQVKYGKNHNYFDLIFFLILETNMKRLSKISQSLETSDLWPTVTWLGWNQIQTVLVQHWTNLQFS